MFAVGEIEDDCRIGIEAEFFPVVDFGFGRVEDDEIGFLVEFSLIFRANEHVRDEVSLPRDFHDKANFHASIFVRAAETVDDEKTLAAEFFNRELFESFPRFDGTFLIIVDELRS